MPQPDAIRSDALLIGPPLQLMEGAAPTLTANIARRAAELPDGLLRSIQADGEMRILTFAEAWRRSGAIADALRAAGIGPGFQVLLVQQDILDFTPAFWASLRVGAVAVPFTGTAKTAESASLAAVLVRFARPAILTDRPSDSADRLKTLLPDAPLVIADGATPPSGAEVFEDAEEAEYPCLIPTSGSTGAVKLAQFSRPALLHRYYSQNYSVPHRSQHLIGVFPFDSLTGLRVLSLNFLSYSQLSPALLTGRPQAILEMIPKLGATHAHMTMSMAAALVESDADLAPGLDLSSLKMIGLGGEAMARGASIAFSALLARRGAHDALRAGYGATETGSILAGADPSTAPLDDAGAIILGGCAAGISLRIVDDKGRLLPEGEVGNIEVWAPQTLFSGYYGEHDLDCFTADGWWKSGDLGVVNDRGFSFRGRAKQTLVINGRKFSLTDMDARLQGEVGGDGAIYAFVARALDEATDGFGVAFSRTGLEPDDHRAEAIRSASIRCYGVAPRFVLGLRQDEMPRTGTGKIDRKALAERALNSPEPMEGPAAAPTGAVEKVLEDLWREALNWTGELDRAKRFDDCGGDSLRVVALLLSVEQRFGRRVALGAFFENPTFERLALLVEEAPEMETPAAPAPFWPLSEELHRGLLYHVEAWPGARATADRLLLALNEQGDLPPLFCIFNAADEFSDLARALGPRQPLYAFRSAHEVGRRDEDEIQALALRYVRDMMEVCPEGPFFLLGQCQGGRIALAVAEHLRRRGRPIPLLILSEWDVERIFYPDPVLLLYGRDSVQNPRLSSPDGAPDWRRIFAVFAEREVDGGYSELYHDKNIASLSGEVARHCQAALAEPPRAFDAAAPAIGVSVERALGPLLARRRFRLNVKLRNNEATTIDGENWGLWLSGLWRRQDDASLVRAVRVPVPTIAPGQTVRIRYRATAPKTPGAYDFFLEIVQDGRKAGRDPSQAPFQRRIEVAVPAEMGWLQRIRAWVRMLRDL